MTTILLYGALGKKFGRTWRLEIDSIAEAVRAIDSQARGFARQILDLNCAFRVKRDKQPVSEQMLRLPPGKVISIVPCPSGAAKGKGILTAILGVALIGAAFLPVFAGAAAGTFLAGVKTAFISVGLGLTLTGVSSLLSRSPSKESSDDPRRPGYLFSGDLGVTQQGDPVPVLYGRRVIFGRVVSAGISARDYTAGSTNNSGGNSTVPDPAAPGGPIYNEP